MEKAVQLIPATMGVHRPDGPGATLVEIGGHTADDPARYLFSRATPPKVLEPDTVRDAFQRRVRELVQSM